MGPNESHEKKVFRKNPNMGLQAILSAYSDMAQTHLLKSAALPIRILEDLFWQETFTVMLASPLDTNRTIQELFSEKADDHNTMSEFFKNIIRIEIPVGN